MSRPPYRSGDFVWSNFPQRENPARPGPRHLGYVAVSTNTGQQTFSAVLAYTTTRPWPEKKPSGVHGFDRDEATAMGQAPFILDLRRLAWVPVTPEWFPDLNEANHGTVGRAPETLRAKLEKELTDLLTRHPENIEHLGPLRPGSLR